MSAPQPDWVEELRSRNLMLVEGLVQLANGLADVEERLAERIHVEIAEAEARLLMRMRTELGMTERQISGNISSEAADLRQIGHLASRKAGRIGPRIRCIFLVHAIESWDAQIDIHEAMLRDDRFEPIVASINRRFPGDSVFRGEDETSAALDRAGIHHIRLGMEPSWSGLDILRALHPDVIFRQSQWEADVPPAFQTARINFARICSVPYGMGTVAKYSPDDTSEGGVNEKTFDQFYHRMAWRIFCETDQTKAYFTQFRHSDPDKFIVSGYPKLNRLLRARDEAEIWPVAAGSGGRRFRVIWAPHYSVGTEWLGFGVFDHIYEDFLAWARARTDMDFVLKPHPALFSAAVQTGSMTQEALDGFLRDWCDLPNCAVELGTYAHLFAASDMMVSDGVSFFAEYPIFEKPLVYFDSGHHVPMNILGDAALACAHRVTSFEEMRGAVEAYAAGAEWAFEAERQAFLNILFPRDRAPVDIILDAIAEGMDAEAADLP
ncbi:MAG: hypothetical protein QM690_01205 [Sphingobium sp.]